MSAEEEGEQASRLRRLIRETHENGKLSPSQKARRIRLLISSGGSMSEQELEASLSSSSTSSASLASAENEFSDSEKAKSYHKPPGSRPPVEELPASAEGGVGAGEGAEGGAEGAQTEAAAAAAAAATYHWEEDGSVLGCKHYPRACKLRAPCCKRLVACRFCHDETYSDHKIDRYAVEEAFCMRCQTLQPFASSCSQCGQSFGRWYCGYCHFIDDTPNKLIFHCDKCKLCRVAVPNTSYEHCDRCCSCVIANQPHTCIPQAMKSDCPICSEDLFTSVRPSVALKCGHYIHAHCQKQYLRQGHSRCPLCKKTITDSVFAQAEWAAIANAIRAQPMPPEFEQTRIQIHCNDCNQTSTVPFHFFGAQCPTEDCQSFNTSRLNIFNFPTYSQSALPLPPADLQDPQPDLESESDDSGSESGSDSDPPPDESLPE